MKKYLGYDLYEEADGDYVLDGAPCGCQACDRKVQPGHFACAQPTQALIDAEDRGQIVRHYNGTSWVWVRTGR